MRSIQLAVLALAAAALAAGCDSARPIASGANNTSAAERCGVCHGYPPPPFIAGGSSHPASTSCYLCHPSTVDAAGNIVAGGTHLNGKVDLGIHPIPYVAQHTGPALSDLNACKVCHGNDFSGGQAGVSCTNCHNGFGYSDWQTNCTFCHGTRTQGFDILTSPLALAAPPRGTHGETDATVPQVGAHQKHVGNGSTFTDGVDCTECHTLPADLTHVTGAPATLTFGSLAAQGGLAPSYSGGSCSATYCHGAGLQGGTNTTPVWTSPSPVACGDCHGSPPATGRHLITAQHASRECSACHALVATSTPTPGIQNTPAAKGLHVNGVKDVNLIVEGTWDPATKSCSNVGCHTLPPATRFWSP